MGILYRPACREPSPYPRAWSALGFANLSIAGLLTGLHDLPTPRRFEFVPFTAPGIVRDYDANTPATISKRYGFDLRLGLSSNLTADLTYKTDFAQVEADQEVVNLSRFSLFFPEKRRFFTESAGIFDYGRTGIGYAGGDQAQGPGLLALFYSRTVGLNDGKEVPLLAGGKVTGRVGPYALGLFNIETSETTLAGISGADVLIPRANYSGVRVKRNILAKSTIGAMLLNRQGGPGSAYNRSAGLDAGLAFGKSVTIAAMLAKTFSPGVRGRDVAGAVDVAYKVDKFNSGATYLDVQEQFNAEMGFVPRRDIRNTKLSAYWTPRPGWSHVRQLTFGESLDYYESHDGRVASRTTELTAKLQAQNASSITFNLDQDYDNPWLSFKVGDRLVPVGSYRWNTVKLNYASDTSRHFYGTAGTDLGSYYGGKKQTYRAGLNLIPFTTLLIENSYTRNNIDLPAQPRYTTNTLSTRISYSFSPNLFVKSFFQYNDDRRLATLNLLFWYVYRPGSDLYVVYNNGWQTAAPGLSPRILDVRNRSLSLKFTYWLSR